MTSPTAKSTRSTKPHPFLFWCLVAGNVIVIFLMVVLTVGEMFTNHQPDLGGGLLVLIVLSVALGFVIRLYLTTTEQRLQRLAVGLLASPVLFVFAIGTYFSYLNQRVDLPSDYFSSGGAEKALQPLAEAVARRDIEYLKEHGPGANLNLKSKRGMTLLKLAIHKIQRTENYPSPAVELPVIKTLLELGAKPGDELWWAFYLRDEAILTALLDGGADPNRMPPDDCLMLEHFESIELDRLRLLVKHGLNIATICSGQAIALKVASYDVRTDLLVFLIEHGADFRKPDKEGRTVASFIDENIARMTRGRGTPDPELLRAKALVSERR